MAITDIQHEAPAFDPEATMDFVHRVVGEVGAAMNAALVVLGDELGYYRALADGGPLTAGELAERTGTDARYASEWLNAQAAGDFVDYDPRERRFSLPVEHAAVLADPDFDFYLPGFFQIAHGALTDLPRIVDAARAGGGFGWHERSSDVHTDCGRFFLPIYRAQLVQSWLPALDGVVDKLTAGASVADLGCGHGGSTILMAQAFEESTFVGFDYHASSVEAARARADAAGVGDRVRFEVADAATFGGGEFDLITMFDCLHDLGDPVGAARRVLSALAADGTWLVVEPAAADRVEENLTPVSRVYYAFSVLLCTPASLAQPVGRALGTQAGQARLASVAAEAGFASFRRVAETPFNMVFEGRSQSAVRLTA